MNSVSAQNLEDASNIATEFIYSIDNLHHEVRFLLEEIQHKDRRVNDLHQTAESEAARFVKYALPRTAAAAAAATGSPTPGSPGSLNEANLKKIEKIPDRLQTYHAEIMQLSDEKILLASKLTELIQKTRARLDLDIVKVKFLQGEHIEAGATLIPGMIGGGKGGYFGTNAASMRGGGVGMGGAIGLSTPLGVQRGDHGFPLAASAERMSEAVRAALAAPTASGAASPSGASTPTGPPNKKRRVTAATPSIKLPAPSATRSASPAAASQRPAAPQRSRLSRQIHPTSKVANAARIVDEDDDPDAEGDEDAEGDDDDDVDTRNYCFCQKKSYGEMIGCDNEGLCPYEWFHLACVGLKEPLAEDQKWFCSHCIDKGIGGAKEFQLKKKK